ncbi:MAG: DUF4907 domain-containing protein [Cytophagia bacterium]|nr:DUF4907 domain-containing protein [Cytophagia bacterium]
MRLLILLIILILAACTPGGHKEVSSSSLHANDSTVGINSETSLKVDNFEIKTFAQSTGGYGYEIFMNGSKIIYQPTIPGLPGNAGFATAEKAQKTGELVVYKIRNGQLPPSVSPEELDSLGVLK